MNDNDKYIDYLEFALNDPDFDVAQFYNWLGLLLCHKQLKIKLFDFEYNNKERAAIIAKKKTDCIESMNFEDAASFRDKEKEILKYIKLREEYDISKSVFHFEEGYLIYLYLNTEKNDRQIKEIIQEKFR